MSPPGEEVLSGKEVVFFEMEWPGLEITRTLLNILLFCHEHGDSELFAFCCKCGFKMRYMIVLYRTFSSCLKKVTISKTRQ